MSDSPVTQDLQEALSSAERIMRGDRRDWTANRHDAFLFGLFYGWDCEQDHTHDSTCPEMASVAQAHGWDENFVARLRRLRRGVRAATSQAPSA
jgi:hypothetical protein